MHEADEEKDEESDSSEEEDNKSEEQEQSKVWDACVVCRCLSAPLLLCLSDAWMRMQMRCRHVFQPVIFLPCILRVLVVPCCWYLACACVVGMWCGVM